MPGLLVGVLFERVGTLLDLRHGLCWVHNCATSGADKFRSTKLMLMDVGRYQKVALTQRMLGTNLQ